MNIDKIQDYRVLGFKLSRSVWGLKGVSSREGLRIPILAEGAELTSRTGSFLPVSPKPHGLRFALVGTALSIPKP